MIRLLSLVFFFCLSITAHANEKLLVLGDSLSAGYNMPIENSWPSLLPDVLLEHGQNVTVINGSISGDTTGNGLARLPQLLEQHSPDIVLIELGANDGLRGFPPKLITANLSKMITMIKDFGAEAIVMQIRVPPNYGKRYSDMFYDIYPKLADHQQIQLMPFFLEHLVTKPDWIMPDGLHPKPEAQPWIADFVAQELIKYPYF
ncbi:arylesterase [Vibrio sp. B1FLJ16]|uniref:arylesterase n=1 Tax=Vibrio sp. B1FLJ16 TaxID=2751178 RepID=UPI0015F53428|nr:arylesterase [Vibrio sp. B1FLJ16]